jgi:hypothetical protein
MIKIDFFLQKLLALLNDEIVVFSSASTEVETNTDIINAESLITMPDKAPFK